MRIALPLAPLPLLVLIAAWLLPGLIGHAPWKTDDAIGIGVMHQFASHGDWLLPRLAGEYYADDGPLFYWIAAAFAKLLSWVMAPHDAARLAGGACIALALAFLRLAGRRFYDNDYRDQVRHDNDNLTVDSGRKNASRVHGDSVLLVCVGSLGLLLHAHETISETALLAGLACAYYGVALAPKRPLAAGIALGCGLGAAFLATGIAPILPLAAALLAVPVFVPNWRSRNTAIAAVCGLVALLPWLLLWPALLHARSPEFYAAWLQKANLAALTQGFSLATAGYSLQTLAWFAWPAWPIALWALWLCRRKRATATTVVPLVALLVGLALACVPREQRELPLLPLLAPLSLLAGQAVGDLRRGAANSLAWFGAMTFTLLGGLVWLGYLALQTGIPPRIAANAARLEPGFVSQFALAPLLLAVALTVAWFALILKSERSAHRSATFWAAGLALFWGLAITLILPWIDYGKTYRPVAQALLAHLPRQHGCIASRGLGEAQRAAFDYHAGIVTQRIERRERHNCRLLLVQDNAREPEVSRGEQWKKIWEGNRPGDRSEKYRLYSWK